MIISLIIEALFALVFLHSLLSYLRHRDRIQRDLTLVFAPLASFLVVEVVLLALGIDELPTGVAYVAVTLLLAQPYLTMRLVRTLRPVPRWVMRVVLAVFVVTTVPFYLLWQRGAAAVTLVAVVGFFSVQALAAVLLAREARTRSGSPAGVGAAVRARLRGGVDAAAVAASDVGGQRRVPGPPSPGQRSGHGNAG
jgi:hypothetical protein